METTTQNQEPEQAGRKGSPVRGVLVAIALLLAGGIFWYLLSSGPTQNAPAGTTTANLSMSAAEQEYGKNIQIANIALSRAENFLHQEVTTVNGEVYNAGGEAVSGLRLTIQFADDMNQMVLRETREVGGAPEGPLAPGEHRTFEIAFEHVPASWNMQQPSVRVSYLHLTGHK
jgi:FlaG/FlaF family flagellin (archaellin)